MSKEYDEITARHYKAYRPALHTTILKKCIARDETFSLGLDVGCGTGQSAHALSNFCQRVTAVEPSLSMLENAIPHPKIDYLPYRGKPHEFKTESFEIVTFAGSLFYCRSQQLLDDVVHSCKNGAAIIVYDFEISLESLLEEFGFVASEETTYDHEVDFSGLRTNRLAHISKGKETIPIQPRPTDLAHLILSVREHHSFFRHKWQTDDPHPYLTKAFGKIPGFTEFRIRATLFFTRYRVSKK